MLYLCSTPSWSQVAPDDVKLLFEVPSLRVISSFPKFHPSMENLLLTKTCRKQIVQGLSPTQSCSQLKVVQGRLLKSEIHGEIPKLFQFYGCKTTSVSSPPLKQNRIWRKKKYSSRYLLYESFQHPTKTAIVQGVNWLAVLLASGSDTNRLSRFLAQELLIRYRYWYKFSLQVI